jgi:GAF domain-containing protein
MKTTDNTPSRSTFAPRDGPNHLVAQLTLINEVGKRIAAQLELEGILDTATRLVQENFDYHHVALFTFTPDGRALVMRSRAGDFAGLFPPNHTLKLNQGMVGWVADHGLTRLANDVGADDQYVNCFPDLVPTRAELSVPVRAGDAVLGVLDAQSPHLNTFHDHDVMVLETLADQIAVAMENARLYEAAQRELEERRRAEEERRRLLSLEREQRLRAESLFEVTLALSSKQGLREVLQEILYQAGRIVPYRTGNIMLMEGDQLRTASARGYEEFGVAEFVSQLQNPLRDIPLDSYVLRDQRPLVVHDAHANPDWIILPETSWVRSNIIIPISYQERALGVMHIDGEEVGQFSEEDAQRLLPLAHAAALALDNARHREEAERWAQEQSAAGRIARALNSLDIREAFPVLVKELQGLTGCERVSLAQIEGPVFRMINLQSPTPVLEEGTVLPMTATAAGEDVLAGRTHFTSDLAEELAFPAETLMYEAGFRSRVNIPLRVGERVIGSLNLSSMKLDHLRREQIPLLEKVGDGLAIAIENSRLFQAERNQRKLAEALAQTAKAVGQSLELDQVLDAIRKQIERVVRGDEVTIQLIDRDGPYLSPEACSLVEDAPTALAEDECPPIAQLASLGRPVVVSDTREDERWIPRPGLEGVRSYVGAPIRLLDTTIGYLNVHGCEPDSFDLEDAGRLQAFADQVAVAVQNAQLYRALQGHAETLEERVKERTAEIEAQYARLHAILHSTADGIVVTDEGGEILDANPVAKRWLDSALDGESVRQIRQAIEELTARVEERPQSILELEGLDLEIHAAPIHGSGDGAHAVIALHDVSRLKELDRMKSRFIANVSHELRTPVTTIQLCARLLQNPQSDKWQRHVELLRQEAERQAQLVQDILELVRNEANGLQLQLEWVDFNQLVAGVVKDHRVVAVEQRIELEYHAFDHPLRMRVDPDKMARAISNLITNALRYSKEAGHVSAVVDVVEDDGRAWVTLEVVDRGVGIPEQELTEIFTPFFRGEMARRLQMPGTGLGLPIAKELAELHGGRITVESQVGVGTTSTLWLPLDDERVEVE